MDAMSMADAILRALGGAENVMTATHCATRLRVNPRELSRVNAAALGAVPGVLAAQVVGEQVQIVVGPGRVDDVADAVDRRLAPPAAAGNRAGRRPKFLRNISLDKDYPMIL